MKSCRRVVMGGVVGLALLAGVTPGCGSGRGARMERWAESQGFRLDGKEKAARMLTGSFSSAEQAAADPEHFLDIRLRSVRIWENRRSTGREGRLAPVWLYVEQASASASDRPYRQRVYEIVDGREDGHVLSRVYTLPEPSAWAGAWRDPSRFDALRPEDLTLRFGCTVELEWDEVALVFVGGTRGEACASDLGGASYATSEVRLGWGGMATWDRGYDAEGRQVWGSETGPYQFVRVREARDEPEAP